MTNGVGRQITDYNLLQSDSYIDGAMRLAKVYWCTEGPNNSGKVTLLQFTLASFSQNTINLLPLNKMGISTDFC